MPSSRFGRTGALPGAWENFRCDRMHVTLLALAVSLLLQVGSGAEASTATVHEAMVIDTSRSHYLRGLAPSTAPLTDALGSAAASTSQLVSASPVESNLRMMTWTLGALSLFLIASHMMPGNTGSSGTHRQPPGWNPENEPQYSFRSWMTDISLWVALTDLTPQQQCAAIVFRLEGAAREVARSITPANMIQGGNIGGVIVDPVTFLLRNLQTRFAALEEETRLTAMTEMMAFARRPGEGINALLARFEIVRTRAFTESGYTMAIQGYSLLLLRCCNINAHQLPMVLQPWGGRHPATEGELQLLITNLRRLGHITENTSGNIGQSLQGAFRQARPVAYYAEEEASAYFGDMTRDDRHQSVASVYTSFANENPWQSWAAPLPSPAAPSNGTSHSGYAGGTSADVSTSAYWGMGADGYYSGTDADTFSDEGDADHLSRLS